MAEFTDYDRERLDEMHAIITNGMRENVRRLADNFETVNNSLEYMKSEAYKYDTCPILKQRRNARISWDRLLVIGVGLTSILSSGAAFAYLILR